MVMGLRIAVYGFGEIGRLIARVALSRGHEIVGAVDINPEILGKDVGDILGLGKLDAKVTRNVEEAMKKCDVILHATGSYLAKVYDQIASAAALGKPVISTCETLAYPYYRYPILARRLDELARTHGSTVLGSGINPGFLLDTLFIVASAAVPIIKRARARRCLDASRRRDSFKRKIGLGLEPSEVMEGLRSGKYSGHVGYAESICLIADAAGLNLSRVEEGQEPVIADQQVRAASMIIERGRVRGIRGYGAGYVDDVERIRIEFEGVAGAQEYEEMILEGEDYSIAWRSSGTPGDLGTASIILSLAERIDQMPYGLLTMADIMPFGIRFAER
jgi:4-hydroxy-tetrahydrodipicolinate reductase